MAGQGLPKIKLWDFSFAVFHSARFDPFLWLACYLDSDLDFSHKRYNNGGQAKAGYVELRCGGMNAGFRETM